MFTIEQKNNICFLKKDNKTIGFYKRLQSGRWMAMTKAIKKVVATERQCLATIKVANGYNTHITQSKI